MPNLSAVPGVSHLMADGQTVHLDLRGPVRPLLQTLAAQTSPGSRAGSRRLRSCS